MKQKPKINTDITGFTVTKIETVNQNFSLNDSFGKMSKSQRNHELNKMRDKARRKKIKKMVSNYED